MFPSARDVKPSTFPDDELCDVGWFRAWVFELVEKLLERELLSLVIWCVLIREILPSHPVAFVSKLNRKPQRLKLVEICRSCNLVRLGCPCGWSQWGKFAVCRTFIGRLTEVFGYRTNNEKPESEKGKNLLQNGFSTLDLFNVAKAQRTGEKPNCNRQMPELFS